MWLKRRDVWRSILLILLGPLSLFTTIAWISDGRGAASPLIWPTCLLWIGLVAMSMSYLTSRDSKP